MHLKQKLNYLFVPTIYYIQFYNHVCAAPEELCPPNKNGVWAVDNFWGWLITGHE